MVCFKLKCHLKDFLRGDHAERTSVSPKREFLLRLQHHAILKPQGDNSCKRCRDQKIRCTGSYPCDQCSKRNSACDFESPSQRVLVTRRHVEVGYLQFSDCELINLRFRYITELHDRLASYENRSASSRSRPGQLESTNPASGSNAPRLPFTYTS